MTEQKKRLVIATDNFLPRWDGIARFLAEIISKIKKNYDITIITADFPGYYDDPSIKIIRFPLRKFHIGDFPPSKPNSRIIKKEVKKADIVWVQTIGPIGSKTINIAKRFRKKIIAYNHSIEWELVPNAIGSYIFKKFFYDITKHFARRYYNKCDMLLVPTQEVSEKLSRHKINPKKIVAPLGVDTDTFVSPGRKAAAKLAIGINYKYFVVGYVGRIAREKDLKTLFRAFIRFQKFNPKSKLLIVGDGVESIKNILSRRKDVILTGTKDNIIPYLHAMDVFVLSSLTETTSLSTLEAMSCEIPIISTNVGLAKTEIKNGINGYIVKRKDAYSIYRNILKLSKDPLLGPKIGRKARETVIEKFSWKRTVNKIEEAIESVIDVKKEENDNIEKNKKVNTYNT